MRFGVVTPGLSGYSEAFPSDKKAPPLLANTLVSGMVYRVKGQGQKV